MTVDIDNFVKFAEWFDKQNIQVKDYLTVDYGDLTEWSYQYTYGDDEGEESADENK